MTTSYRSKYFSGSSSEQQTVLMTLLSQKGKRAKCTAVLEPYIDTANEEVVSKTRKGKRGTGSGTEK